MNSKKKTRAFLLRWSDVDLNHRTVFRSFSKRDGNPVRLWARPSNCNCRRDVDRVAVGIPPFLVEVDQRWLLNVGVASENKLKVCILRIERHGKRDA